MAWRASADSAIGALDVAPAAAMERDRGTAVVVLAAKAKAFTPAEPITVPMMAGRAHDRRIAD
jgi:hypothetical protein